MHLNRYTSLGRTVDLRYPTNLAIVALALLAGAVAAAWHWIDGSALWAAIRWGASAGLATFLAWALTRELDPDNDLSAFGSASLVLAGLAVLGLPAMLPILWELVALRLVIRTTGLPARPLDSLGLLGLGLGLCWQYGWTYGVLTAAVFYLDGRLTQPVQRHLWLAALALALTPAVVLLAGVEPPGTWSEPLPLALLGAVLLLFAFVVASQGRPAAVGDANGVLLQRDRLRAGQTLAAAILLVTTWWAGQAGLAEIWPLAAALLSVSVYRFLIVPWLARRDRLGGS